MTSQRDLRKELSHMEHMKRMEHGDVTPKPVSEFGRFSCRRLMKHSWDTMEHADAVSSEPTIHTLDYINPRTITARRRIDWMRSPADATHYKLAVDASAASTVADNGHSTRRNFGAAPHPAGRS